MPRLKLCSLLPQGLGTGCSHSLMFSVWLKLTKRHPSILDPKEEWVN